MFLFCLSCSAYNLHQVLYQEVQILQVQIPAGSEGIDVTRARGWRVYG